MTRDANHLELMASKINFGKRLRVTGHEYRKMDNGDALRWGCSCENRFVKKVAAFL